MKVVDYLDNIIKSEGKEPLEWINLINEIKKDDNK